MLGWITIFIFMFLAGLTSVLAGDASDASFSLKLATVIFGTLLLACLIIRVARDRV